MPGGGLILGGAGSCESRQAAAELSAARQADAVALASKVAELEQTKKQMEEHSAALLAELRTFAVRICDGVSPWREEVRKGSAEHAALPNRELPFCWRGVSYLL